MKQITRVALVLVVAALATLGLAGTASAQSYTGAVASASASSVAPGGDVTISGENFLPNATVTVTWGDTVLGTTTTDDDGSFSFTFAAPTEVGAHTVTATDGVNTVTVSFEVVGAAAPVTGAGTLPYTGNDSSLPLVQIGAGLLAAGAVVMLTVRKRNTLAHAKVDA